MAARTKLETRIFYDRMSRVYDLLAEGSEGPIKDVAVHKLSPGGGERILEIGCGTGHVLVALAAGVGPAGHIIGLDLSPGMLAAAGETISQSDATRNVGLVCGNALRLPVRETSLDAVFMSFTLELFGADDLPGVLSECKRVLRPTGRIVIASVSTEGQHGLAYEAYEWAHRRFPTLVDCRPISLAQTMEAAGFRVREQVKASMWVPVEIVIADISAGC